MVIIKGKIILWTVNTLEQFDNKFIILGILKQKDICNDAYLNECQPYIGHMTCDDTEILTV